jgi:hypothetical protein
MVALIEWDTCCVLSGRIAKQKDKYDTRRRVKNQRDPLVAAIIVIANFFLSLDDFVKYYQSLIATKGSG